MDQVEFYLITQPALLLVEYNGNRDQETNPGARRRFVGPQEEGREWQIPPLRHGDIRPMRILLQRSTGSGRSSGPPRRWTGDQSTSSRCLMKGLAAWVD